MSIMDGDRTGSHASLDIMIPDLWSVVWQRLPEESDKWNFAATCRCARAGCTAYIAGTRAAQLAKQDRAFVQPDRALRLHDCQPGHTPVHMAMHEEEAEPLLGPVVSKEL